jgi:hypothetical protein
VKKTTTVAEMGLDIWLTLPVFKAYTGKEVVE